MTYATQCLNIRDCCYVVMLTTEAR